MENMNPTNQPVSFYGDNNRGTDSALLASMATKDFGHIATDTISGTGISDLRESVMESKFVTKDAEASIRREIAQAEADMRADIFKEGQDNMIAIKDAHCDLSKSVLESRHTLAKDIMRSEYESKLAIQTATKEIFNKLDAHAERTNEKIDFFERRTTDKFCEVNDNIKALRTQALEDKILQQSQDLQTAKLEKIICCGCPSTGNVNNR